MLDMMNKKAYISAIFMISLFIILIPIYVYLLMKWYKHRNHFVIQNRFPNISIAVFILSVLGQLASFTEVLTNIAASHCISLVFATSSVGFLFYRLHLIYVRWFLNAQFLKTVTELEFEPNIKQHSSLMSRFLFFVLVVLVPVLMSFNIFPSGSVPILCLIQMTIGILLAIRVFRSNVSESLDCVRESVISIIFALVLSFLPPVLFQFVPSCVDIHRIGGFFASSVIGCCSLYISVHLIHKVEKVKRVNSDTGNQSPFPVPITLGGIHSSPQASMPDVSAIMNTVVLSSYASELNVPTTTISPNRSISMIRAASESHDSCESPRALISIDLNVSLAEFLKTLSHYQLFAGYLSECFALENLMFLERGIILYHMILRFKELDACFVQKKKESENENKMDNKCYQLRFDYLPHLYDDMKCIILKAVESNTTDDDMIYKRGILKVMKLIFTRCCGNKSVTPINISYGVQKSLLLLESMDEKCLLETFTDYDALPTVFHNAIVEIWDVCECVYDFQFKAYCKKHMT